MSAKLSNSNPFDQKNYVPQFPFMAYQLFVYVAKLRYIYDLYHGFYLVFRKAGEN